MLNCMGTLNIGPGRSYLLSLALAVSSGNYEYMWSCLPFDPEAKS